MNAYKNITASFDAHVNILCDDAKFLFFYIFLHKAGAFGKNRNSKARGSRSFQSPNFTNTKEP